MVEDAVSRLVRGGLGLAMSVTVGGCTGAVAPAFAVRPAALHFALSRADLVVVPAPGASPSLLLPTAAIDAPGGTAAPPMPGQPPALPVLPESGAGRGSAPTPETPGNPFAGGAGQGPTAMQGTVRLAVPDGVGPIIPGAHLHVVGPLVDLEIDADADGHFALPLPDGIASVLVTAPGHAATLLPTWSGDPLDVHLQNVLLPLTPSPAEVPVHGRVLRPDGSPGVFALVIGADGHGSSFGPLVADAEGYFAGTAHVTGEGNQVAMAIFALDRQVSGTVSSVAFLPTAPVGDNAPALALALQAPTGTVRVIPTGPPGTVSASVALRAANGARLVLYAWRSAQDLTQARYFSFPGAVMEAEAEIVTDEGRRSSAWRGTIDTPGLLKPKLLAYPAPADTGLTDGVVFRWPGIVGATSYRLSLREAGMPAPVWEAWAAEAAVPVRGVPTGALTDPMLALTALEGGPLRALASLPNHLRLDVDPTVRPTRWATTLVPYRP